MSDEPVGGQPLKMLTEDGFRDLMKESFRVTKAAVLEVAIRAIHDARWHHESWDKKPAEWHAGMQEAERIISRLLLMGNPR